MDSDCRYVLRQAGREPCPASNRPCLFADLADASCDNIFDLAWIDIVALNQGLKHLSE
ncbi:hypothetical protein MOKP64_12720 [Mycobacterium avium subsp. hominissuis]